MENINKFDFEKTINCKFTTNKNHEKEQSEFELMYDVLFHRISRKPFLIIMNKKLNLFICWDCREQYRLGSFSLLGLQCE